MGSKNLGERYFDHRVLNSSKMMDLKIVSESWSRSMVASNS
jgi:hypothetical protein